MDWSHQSFTSYNHDTYGTLDYEKISLKEGNQLSTDVIHECLIYIY
jgi:hypothetical protein